MVLPRLIRAAAGTHRGSTHRTAWCAPCDEPLGLEAVLLPGNIAVPQLLRAVQLLLLFLFLLTGGGALAAGSWAHAELVIGAVVFALAYGFIVPLVRTTGEILGIAKKLF